MAAAAEPGLGVSAAQSHSEEYQAQGVRAGSFTLYALVEMEEEYDDNIYKLPDGSERDDYIFHVKPTLSLQSDWSRHALNADLSADLAYYSDHTNEDYNDFNVFADGRIDVLRNSYTFGKIGYSSLHEDRRTLDTRLRTEPTLYDYAFLGLGYNHIFNRLEIAAAYDYQWLDYDEVPDILGDTVSNDDRDRKRDVLNLRVGYDVRPQFNTYLEGSVNQVDYDQQFDRSDRERSSTGYRAVAGLNVDITSVLVGDFFLGYLHQEYDDSFFEDIDDPAYGFGLTWFATDLTTVYGSLKQGPEETTEPTASGYLSTVFNARVNHELKRNIILTGKASRTDNQYQQSVPGKKESENILAAGLSAKYLFTNRFYMAASYDFERRDSDIELQEYSDNTVMLTVGAQL